MALDDSGLDLNSIDKKRENIRFGVGGIETLEAEHTKLMERGARRVSLFIPMMISNMWTWASNHAI